LWVLDNWNGQREFHAIAATMTRDEQDDRQVEAIRDHVFAMMKKLQGS
jgi:hypothetical protein